MISKIVINITSVTILLSYSCSGQIQNPSLQSLIDAEKKFANLSKDQSTRKAFLENLDDSSIVFQNGEALYGLQLWQDKKPNQSLLFWWPEAAGISSSGDLGFTTGPFIWSKDRSGNKPDAAGYYSTVWKKNASGNWKIAVDLGSGNYDVNQKTDSGIYEWKISPGKPDSQLASLKSIEIIDKQYNDQLKLKKKSFIQEYIDKDFRIYRAGEKLISTSEKNISESEKKVVNYNLFSHTSAGIASAGDLAYTYGKIIFEKSNNKVEPSPTNYLRVWRITDGKWKIILDVEGE